MDDRDVLTIINYIDDGFSEPRPVLPEAEFKRRSYSCWAANEILERAIRETDKLPVHITGLYPVTAMEMIEEFVCEMDRYRDECEDPGKKQIFEIASSEAKKIGRLFV